MAQIGNCTTATILAWVDSTDVPPGVDQPDNFVTNTFGVEGSHMEPTYGQIWPRLA